LTWPILRDHLDAILTVDDEAILEAVHFLAQRLKIVVEPSGAVPVAVLFSEQCRRRALGRVGVIISGGNLDLSFLGGG